MVTNGTKVGRRKRNLFYLEVRKDTIEDDMQSLVSQLESIGIDW